MFNWFKKEKPFSGFGGFGGGGLGLSAAGGGDGLITIEMWGAGGGRGDNGPHNQAKRHGAGGGHFVISETPYSSLGLSSGKTFYIYVGGGGNTNTPGGQGNSNGGPNGGRPGSGGNGGGAADFGGGGGATSIYVDNPYSSGTLLLVAGGGGGGAAGVLGYASYPSGYGGNTPPTGTAPSDSIFNSTKMGGGGTQDAGGRGGNPPSYPAGSSGSSFQGGPAPDGGGGGSGYYGGGGGGSDTGTISGGQGGGGSNYHNPAFVPDPNIVHSTFYNDPYFGPVVNPVTPPAYNIHPLEPSLDSRAFGSTSPYNPGGTSYGFGGPTSGPNPGKGGDGYVVITTPTGTSTFSYTNSEQSFTLP